MKSNQHKTDELITSRFENWRDELNKQVRQSIDFYSDPGNLQKADKAKVSHWLVAGVSEKNVERFHQIARKIGVKVEDEGLSNEGYGIDSLQLSSFKPGSSSKFKQLQRVAEQLDLELWQEIEQVYEGHGAINQNEIEEGAFDPDLTDADNADDMNGDGIADPLFHLLESDPANGTYGVNAVGAWDQVSGEGVQVGVLDTYHDLNHADLQPAMPTNFDWDGDNNNDGVDANNNGTPDVFESEGFTWALGSANWPANGGNPPGSDQSHGTAVSGIAVGRINGESGIGVAPESDWLPDGFLDHQAQWPSEDYYNYADVVNNSWGMSGLSGTFKTNTPQRAANWQMATERSIQVVSAGNDRDPSSTPSSGWNNSNNSEKTRRENIVVAATMMNGEVEQYSTPGASVFVSAPVNGSNFRFFDSFGGNSNQQYTVTADVTDDGASNIDDAGYTNSPTTTRFNGTSAAAPMVTGSVALMLEANPNLDWRNVQHILAQTSVKNGLIDSNGDGELDAIDPNAGGNAADPTAAGTIEMRDTFVPGVNTTFRINDGHNTGWFQNGAGHWVSDSFGFGIVDAGAAVDLASNWTPVGEELKVSTDTILSNPYTIQEGNLGGLNSLQEAGSWDVDTNLDVEWVELNVKFDLPEQDEIMLAIESPSGTRSVLMAPGGSDSIPFPSNPGQTQERTLITNQFWGEDSSGEWSIEVLDTNIDGNNTAQISEASLDIYGTCDKQSPMLVRPFEHLEQHGIDLKDVAQRFLNDGGATNQSFTLQSVKALGDDESFGSFSKGHATGLKIDQGLIFTTGLAKDAIGPNSAPNTTTNWQGDGSPLLGANSRDLSGMEIRFTAKRDMVLDWKAQFGSEEFDESSPSVYDDKAGIFFTEVTSPKDKLENLKPVNLLYGPGYGDFSVNGFSKNRNLYEKHMQGNEPCGPLSWEYDGTMREAMTSKQAVLERGKTYAIAPMIADATDHIYDSGIIIGSKQNKVKGIDIFPRPEKKLFETRPDILKDPIMDIRGFEQTVSQHVVQPSKLSEREIGLVNWDAVELGKTRGKNAIDYDKSDWNTIIDSNGFGEQAAESLQLSAIPDHSLSQGSIDKLLNLGATIKPGLQDTLMM